MKRMLPGRVMVDVEGLELNERDLRRLQHASCAGVILFSRNYDNPQQLRSLCDQIKAARDPALLIAVDQEGGRVQRFRDQFTVVPAMHTIGSLWDRDKQRALLAAHDAGYVIATELGGYGIDFSFAPVLDIDHGCSAVIGDRAFHSSCEAVIALAQAFIEGLNECGMIAVGKHFPGHGAVAADTHHQIAVDHREFAQIERDDLPPFVAFCQRSLGGVMPAHVVYEKVDAQPAGFSKFWLQEVLRDRLGFEGIVFSDDLSMQGASIAGDAPARARAAIAAGCDVVLVCNAPDDADAVLEAMVPSLTSFDADRVSALHRKPGGARQRDAGDDTYQRAKQNMVSVGAETSGPVA